MKTGCLVMAPKGDIARRTMSVCTQQCMAVFWVRNRYTTCDMWMLIYRWHYANRSCMNMLDWQVYRLSNRYRDVTVPASTCMTHMNGILQHQVTTFTSTLKAEAARAWKINSRLSRTSRKQQVQNLSLLQPADNSMFLKLIQFFARRPPYSPPKVQRAKWVKKTM